MVLLFKKVKIRSYEIVCTSAMVNSSGCSLRVGTG